MWSQSSSMDCAAWSTAGYDSAGIAVGGGGNGLELRRAPGKLRNLEEVIRQQPLHGTYGIGHTRWATHGRPTEENAHPHRDCTGRIVVVHNGIVENYLALKKELTAKGHKFVTETDTEIIAHLIEQEIRSAAASGKTLSLEDAVRRAVRRLTGRLRAERDFCRRAGQDRCRAQWAAGGRGAWVRTNTLSPRMCRESCITRAISTFSPMATWPILTLSGVKLTDFHGEPIERKVHADSVGPDPGGKGRLQALHAQGNLRAAACGSRHHAGPDLAGYGKCF